jgi:hypothetical protein
LLSFFLSFIIGIFDPPSGCTVLSLPTSDTRGWEIKGIEPPMQSFDGEGGGEGIEEKEGEGTRWKQGGEGTKRASVLYYLFHRGYRHHGHHL